MTQATAGAICQAAKPCLAAWITLATVGSSACLSTSMCLASLRARSSALALQHCMAQDWSWSLLSALCAYCMKGKTTDAVNTLQMHFTLGASQQVQSAVVRLTKPMRHLGETEGDCKSCICCWWGLFCAMIGGCAPGGLVLNALKVNDVSNAQDAANDHCPCKAHSIQLQVGKEGLLHCL